MEAWNSVCHLKIAEGRETNCNDERIKSLSLIISSLLSKIKLKIQKVIQVQTSKSNSIYFQGDTIDVIVAQDNNECLSKCQETKRCEWYSFQNSKQTCFLLQNCPTLNEELDDFTSGQKSCQLSTTTEMTTTSTTPSPDKDFSKSTKIV